LLLKFPAPKEAFQLSAGFMIVLKISRLYPFSASAFLMELKMTLQF
jgi:hypothetical protein